MGQSGDTIPYRHIVRLNPPGTAIAVAPARKFCSVKKLAGFLLRVSFSSEISVTKVLVFLVSFDSHSILDILFGTHGHSDGHPGPSKKTIPSIQVGIRRFMLRSSKVASI